MFALIGYGPNDVEIPSLIFNDKEDALKQLIPILGEPTKNLIWDVNDILGEDPQDMKIVELFYTSYYPGCGDCYKFQLKEIQPGQPFVQWNLD